VFIEFWYPERIFIFLNAMASILPRNKSKIDFIGHFCSEITGSKLPSNKQVLQVLFFHSRKEDLTVKESIHTAVEKVVVFWDKAGIPT